MHTTRVLLDWTFAFGAWLSINLHPVTRIVITRVDSVLPGLQTVTVNWHVGVLSAREAKSFITLGAFNIYWKRHLLFNCHVTVSSRTPFCLF